MSNPSTSQFQVAIKALDQAAGHKRLVAAFGATDSPIGNGNGNEAVTLANQLASFVANHNFDGVVIDWQETSTRATCSVHSGVRRVARRAEPETSTKARSWIQKRC